MNTEEELIAEYREALESFTQRTQYLTQELIRLHTSIPPRYVQMCSKLIPLPPNEYYPDNALQYRNYLIHLISQIRDQCFERYLEMARNCGDAPTTPIPGVI